MNEVPRSSKAKRLGALGILAIALAVGLTALSISPTGNVDQNKALASASRPEIVFANAANPAPPENACESMQVLVLLDRSGSVTNQGPAVVQKYKDQVKKVWTTLSNISKTYGGFTSGYLWAFAGRTADQMPLLLANDNNKDGVVNEADRNLSDSNVLTKYHSMTQDIYFRNDSAPMYPANQLSSYGYNPKNEDTRYFKNVNYTNWHESFLMAQDTVSAANAPSSAARDYSTVIIVTDGDPTGNDGPNHTWDTFAKNKKIDEVHDGSTSTSSHVTRTKEVVDALRNGENVKNASQKFTPVQVYGVLIGGNNASKNRMNTTYGSGNWFASSNFDTTLGAQLLNIVSQTCPPAATLTGAMAAQIVQGPSNIIEDSDATYIVDVTNTGTASLDGVAVSNGTVIDLPADDKYVSEGILAPGKMRRFQITVHVGGGSTSTNVTLPYSAVVSEDPSIMLQGSPMSLSGVLNAGLSISLVPRPA